MGKIYVIFNVNYLLPLRWSVVLMYLRIFPRFNKVQVKWQGLVHIPLK